MKYRLIILCFLLLSVQQSFAQQNKVKISYDKVNDTIWLSATNIYKPGSLMVVASLANNSDTLFFPLIDSTSFFKLIIPADAPAGILQLQAFQYPKIFEIKGKIENAIKGNAINAILITNNNQLFNKTVTLNTNNEFTLPGLVFENKGSIVFNYTDKKKKSRPDINFEQTPVSKDFKDLIFTETIIIENK